MTTSSAPHIPHLSVVASTPDTATTLDEEEARLPLPTWLARAFALFAVVLYVPDALFNYYVYSDGAKLPTGNPFFQAAQVALWLFLAFGVVGMAWLCSVLAPWHWSRGRHLVALFCGLGVLIAMSVTTWCSLAFRSANFIQFPTDAWVYPYIPWLAAHHVSITMILVAVAPPFWGLFWAIIQPTETRRSRAAQVASHQERLLRMQQEAEVKRLKAETTAKIREAQLRGMAQTAAAARDQAKTLLANRTSPQVPESGGAATGSASAGPASGADGTASGETSRRTRGTRVPRPAPSTAAAGAHAATPEDGDASPARAPVSNPLAAGRFAHVQEPGAALAALYSQQGQ